MTRSSPLKYQPLTEYLAALAADEVTLTLAEVAAIIGAALPVSARQSTFWTTATYRRWSWTHAGWWVERTRLKEEPPTATFVRVRPDVSG
jgi:hypothetical protein